MIEQKKKALADILFVEESDVALGPFGYVVNSCVYEVLCDDDEIKDMLESELDYERQCIEDNLKDAEATCLIPYIDFNKYFTDVAYSLEDFGFDKHVVNDVIYYVREV